MKRCPFCAEAIQDAATVCRYCGRDLNAPKGADSQQPVQMPTRWATTATVFHWRNSEESGWVRVEDTSISEAGLYFWNQISPLIAGLDQIMQDADWEIVPPRDASCLKLEVVRNRQGYNPVASAVNAVLTMGTSLIAQAMGYEKWWISSCTVRWRRRSDTPRDETVNLWMNTKNNNTFERMEQDPASGRWFLWRRPADYRPDDPNDDRWDKEPIYTMK